MIKSIRKWLLAGLLVCLPVLITLWVLNWIVGTLDQTLLILPEEWRPHTLIGMNIPGFGVILAFVILLVLGAITSNLFGRKLLSWWHKLVHKIPVVGSIYSGVKQVSDTLLSDSGNAFRKAVLIQWPREGIWTIAFVTGSPGGDAAIHLPGDFFSIRVLPTFAACF